MEPRIANLVENLYRFDTSHAHNSIGSNAKLAQTLLRDINFVYSVCHSRTLLVATRMTLTPLYLNRIFKIAKIVVAHTAIPSFKEQSTLLGSAIRMMWES
jgi:hypothetical protein